MIAEDTLPVGSVVGAHVYDLDIIVVFGCRDKVGSLSGRWLRKKAVTDVYAAIIVRVLHRANVSSDIMSRKDSLSVR